MQLDLVGSAEIQQILGVKSRQHIDWLMRNRKLPQPVAKIKAGHIWLRKDIEEFGKTWTPQKRNARAGTKHD